MMFLEHLFYNRAGVSLDDELGYVLQMPVDLGRIVPM